MTSIGHQIWLALLVVGVTGFSFVFACAAPFAGFAVLAAMTLSRADAIRTAVALWLVNQIIGYAVLGYPRTMNSLTWGLIIGVTAVLTTLVAQGIVSRLASAHGLARAVAALVGSFAVYEVVLFALAVAGLGGTSAFALPLVGRILVLNAVALTGLYALYRIGAAIGIARRPEVRASESARAVAR